MRFTIFSAVSLALVTSPCLAEFILFSEGEPTFKVVIGDDPSPTEEFAAEEIAFFAQRMCGVRPEIIPERSIPPSRAIIMGTPKSSYLIRDVSDLLHLDHLRKDEGYVLRISPGRIYIGARSDRGVLYGAYELLERTISKATGMEVVSLDFRIPRVRFLSLDDRTIRSEPYFPIRATLDPEDVDWLARHRVNFSLAEGVWSGTGVDDGIASAFKYVLAPRFDEYQDEPWLARWERVGRLTERFQQLKRRGIEPYLFMYLMGEPTKALIRNHPELLGQSLPGDSFDQTMPYHPLCWSNPKLRELLRDLIGEIVRTYPDLAGIHLRAWGTETRPCRCPKCLGREGELLWEIIFDLIEAARSVRPDIRFCISGYGAKWLRDPEGTYLSKLPPGTIILKKWGLDGEPTDDPEIPEDLIKRFDEGKRLVVISHDVEEVMPLWMFEGDLFASGVRRYLGGVYEGRLGGFTLQGGVGLGGLDKIISAALNWSPELDYLSLARNYLASIYDVSSALHILKALQANEHALSSYFSDFCGTLSITGGYGDGSKGFATRLWNLVGDEAVKDTLSIPSREKAEFAVGRLTSLLPQIQLSANEMALAVEEARRTNQNGELWLEDALHMMRFWNEFFEGRLCLVEAVQMGFESKPPDRIADKLNSAVEHSRAMKIEVNEINQFVKVFSYTDQYCRDSLSKKLDGELYLLETFDPRKLVRTEEISAIREDREELKIRELMNVPNPCEDRTTFIWVLSGEGDEAEISIYTLTGRRVMKFNHLEAKKGRNELDVHIDLPNGIYLYRLTVRGDSKRISRIGKLAVLR